TGVAEDRAGAQRARAELHATLHPADRLLAGERLGGVEDHLLVGQADELGAGLGQALGDLVVLVPRAEVRAVHAVHVAVELARLAEIAVVGRERRADRAAGIAGRGLHPDAVEDVLAQQLAVGDAVQRHAAGQADVLRTRLLLHRAGEAQHDLLGHR